MSTVSATTGAPKRKVAYFYDSDIGNYHYGQGHPMKVSNYVNSTGVKFDVLSINMY